jgi:hypothetical protein
LWQFIGIGEQCVAVCYVLGVLPALFSSDPHLFFDNFRCILSAACAAISTGILLSLWTLHSQRAQVVSLAGLLGSWQACDLGAMGKGRGHEREWNPHKSYVAGTVVLLHNKAYRAKGPFEANLSQPGSKAAKVLHIVCSEYGIIVCYDWAVKLQMMLVGGMILAAWVKKKHYVVEVFVSLLNLPAVVLFLYWRRILIASERKV